MSRYSVADAKSQLSRILREAEAGGDVEITRRGRPVAVLVAADRYDDLVSGRGQDFWQRYQEFRARHSPDPGLDPDEIFGDREESAGREFRW